MQEGVLTDEKLDRNQISNCYILAKKLLKLMPINLIDNHAAGYGSIIDLSFYCFKKDILDPIEESKDIMKESQATAQRYINKNLVFFSESESKSVKHWLYLKDTYKGIFTKSLELDIETVTEFAQIEFSTATSCLNDYIKSKINKENFHHLLSLVIKIKKMNKDKAILHIFEKMLQQAERGQLSVKEIDALYKLAESKVCDIENNEYYIDATEILIELNRLCSSKVRIISDKTGIKGKKSKSKLQIYHD